MSFNNMNMEQVNGFLGESIVSAMDALSSILGTNITASCEGSEISALDQADYSHLTPAFYFNIALSGDVQGKIAAVFREVDLSVILKLLMNSDNVDVEFDEMGLGMIREIMSQMAASLASALGTFIGVDVSSSVSAVMNFTDNSLIASVFECDASENVITTNIQFNMGGLMKGKAAFIADGKLGECLESYLSVQTGEAGKTHAAAHETPNAAVNEQAVTVSPSVFPKFDEDSDVGAKLMKGNMDLLMEVPMNVCVEIGKTKKKMKEIMNFSQGTVIPIDKQAGAPVDITVNGQLIARGDVIVINDNFGVRITEIIGT